MTYDVDTRPGVVKVRHDISKEMMLNNGFFYGDYFLMIDAHMGFAKNWDVDLIRDIKYLEKVTGKKEIIISKQSSGHVGKLDSEFADEYIFVPHETSFPLFSNKINLFSTWPKPSTEPLNSISYENSFVHSGWASCHFFFAPYEFLVDVGLDPYSQVFQEEAYLSFKTFLAGYDIYSNRTYNYLGHLSDNQYSWRDPRYWYMSEDGTWIKIFGATKESHYCVLTILAYAKNMGIYGIKNATRTPEDFFKHFNILEIHDNIINDQSMIDFLTYLNQEYTGRKPIDSILENWYTNNL